MGRTRTCSGLSSVFRGLLGSVNIGEKINVYKEVIMFIKSQLKYWTEIWGSKFDFYWNKEVRKARSKFDFQSSEC